MLYSDEQDKIAPAVMALVGGLVNPSKTATNPHFRSKFAPLNATLDMVRDAAFKQGIAVIQAPVTIDGMTGVVTRLVHESGQWVESDPLLLKPQQETPQGYCSAVTYARRYSLEAMLGICGDPDDDGNAASAPPKSEPKRGAPKRTPLMELVELVKSTFPGAEEIATYSARIKREYGVESVKKLNDKQIETEMEWVASKPPF